MSLVTQIFDATDGTGTAGNPDDSSDETPANGPGIGILYPKNRKDQQGYVQFQLSNGAATFDAVVETRFASNAPWVRIMAFDETDTNTFGGVGWLNSTMLTVALPMLPQLRVRVTTAPSLGTLSVWLVE